MGFRVLRMLFRIFPCGISGFTYVVQDSSLWDFGFYVCCLEYVVPWVICMVYIYTDISVSSLTIDIFFTIEIKTIHFEKGKYIYIK